MDAAEGDDKDDEEEEEVKDPNNINATPVNQSSGSA